MELLYKNVASQKLSVFAWDSSAGVAKTGDAAQITATLYIDGASNGATNDTNPTEVGGGEYVFDLTQAETNGNLITVVAASSTDYIEIYPVRARTIPGDSTALDANAKEISDDSTAADNLELIIENAKGADHKILISTDAQDLNTTLTVGSYLKGILATALTETGGYLAAGFKKFFNVETPVATAETVNQTGDSYAVVAHADYGNAKLVRSTTPANALDVSATGEAGLDFNNIKDATGAHTLTNITVPNVTLVATTTTNTDMLTAADVADAIWDEALAGHAVAGTAGKALSDILADSEADEGFSTETTHFGVD